MENCLMINSNKLLVEKLSVTVASPHPPHAHTHTRRDQSDSLASVKPLVDLRLF